MGLDFLAGVFAGDLALEGDLDLAGVFLALVAAFLVGDLALDGDLDLDLAGVLFTEERAETRWAEVRMGARASVGHESGRGPKEEKRTHFFGVLVGLFTAALLEALVGL